MPKLPHAPVRERLEQLPPDIKRLKAGTRLSRIYRRGGAFPTKWNEFRYFGPTSSRFDHHLLDENGQPFEQTRGIIYLAEDGSTALAEVFQERRTVNRVGGRPCLVVVDTAAELSLLDLSDLFCVKAGGSMKLVSGPTVYAQRWSQAFYEIYVDIDGLYYPSSLTNRPAIALYERALAKTPFSKSPVFHRTLNDPLLIDPLRNACADIGYDFV